MSDNAFHEVGRLLSARVGLRMDRSLSTRMDRCVAENAAAAGLSIADYAQHLEVDEGAFQRLLNQITVQETAFFRDPNQFDALASILPEIEGPRTIWSAGCANGQESYSLAMVLAESKRPGWDVVATDISTDALAKARSGTYTERELRGVSAERRDAFLTPVGKSWAVTADLRSRVSHARHNLVTDQPPLSADICPVVFCRNVLIYLQQPELHAFLDRIAAWMPAGGYLFLGFSESLWRVTEQFHLERIGKAFVYRRTGPTNPPRVRHHPTRVRVPGRPRLPAAASPSAPAPRPLPRPLPDTGNLPDLPAVADLLAEGESAISAGNSSRAVAAFRRAAYLDPDHPVTYFQLGAAFELGGDIIAAGRSYAAAKAAIGRCSIPRVEAALEGYRLDELVKVIDLRLQALEAEPT